MDITLRAAISSPRVNGDSHDSSTSRGGTLRQADASEVSMKARTRRTFFILLVIGPHFREVGCELTQ
jgi:hypothetical protein